jgi:ABC-type amino acid transport system permease subunit
MRRMILSSLLLVVSHWATAQGTTEIMGSSGKIFVVLATVLAIYVGIIFFLTVIERKLSNLERQIKE